MRGFQSSGLSLIKSVEPENSHVVKALAYFRPELTSDRAGQVLAFLESFTCEQANPARPASASHEKRSPRLE